jgi:transposase-like protein
MPIPICTSANPWYRVGATVLVSIHSAILPRPDLAILKLNMDAVGVLDFEAGTFALDARGQLVTSDAHEGLKAAITKIFSATWQRCRVHFRRNALAYAGKTQRRIVSAWLGTAFAQDDADAARKQWREVADQARPRVPKLAELMDEAEADVLADMQFPAQHRAKIHSTNPLERLNGEIKRRSEVVGIFPNEAAATRLIGALPLEQNDEWSVQRARYMTLETIAPMSDDPIVGVPALAN